MRVPSSDGVDIAVHDMGGSGEPLLVAHATGFCAGVYVPMVEALRSRFHVWAIDFRGHGDSTAPANGRFAWSAMADDLLAAVDAIGLDAAHGFGHSMGGAVLLLAETRRPGLLRSLFAYEPIVLPALGVVDRPPDTGLAASARRRRAEFPSREDALARYASRRPLNLLRADCLAAYVEHGFALVDEGGTVRLKCDPEHEASTFESAEVTLDVVRGVTVPVVVGAGGREPGTGPATWAPRVADALPAGSLHVFDHLGHFGPFQDPEGVAARVATG